MWDIGRLLPDWNSDDAPLIRRQKPDQPERDTQDHQLQCVGGTVGWYVEGAQEGRAAAAETRGDEYSNIRETAEM